MVHFLPELYTGDPSQILPKWTSTLWELFLRELDLPSDRRGFREANLDLAFWNISSVFEDFRLIRIESKSALRYLWLQSKDKEGERGKQTWEVLKWPQFIAILRRWFDANKMSKKIFIRKISSVKWPAFIEILKQQMPSAFWMPHLCNSSITKMTPIIKHGDTLNSS